MTVGGSRTRGAWARRLGAIALGLVVAPLALELALQAASLFVGGRRGGADASLVLCQGDSNVFGLGLPTELAYPGQLEALLRERVDPNARVANRGVPGKPTWIVERELADDLRSFRPRAVLILAGVNDRNLVRPDDALERALSRSRVVGLVRRTIGNWRERGDATSSEPSNFLDADHVEVVEDGLRRVALPDRTRGTREFELRSGAPTRVEYARWIEEDLERAVATARAHGAVPILCCYFEDRGIFTPVNQAIRSAAARAQAALIDPTAAFATAIGRLDRGAVLFPDAHPTDLGYSVLARLAFNALIDANVIDANRVDPLERVLAWTPTPLDVRPWIDDGVLRGVRVAYRPGFRAQMILSNAEGSTTVGFFGLVRPGRGPRATHAMPLAFDPRFRASLLRSHSYLVDLDSKGEASIAFDPDDDAHAGDEPLWVSVAAVAQGNRIVEVSPALRLR